MHVCARAHIHTHAHTHTERNVEERGERKSGMVGQTQSNHIFKSACAGNKPALCCPPQRDPSRRGHEARPLGHIQAEYRVSSKNAGKYRRWFQGRERGVCKKAGIRFLAKLRLVEKSEFLSCG